MCEPEGLDEYALLSKTIDDYHDIFGSLYTFLNVGADHWVRDFWSAAEICEIIKEKRARDMDHGM
jgi:hypothetical protein